MMNRRIVATLVGLMVLATTVPAAAGTSNKDLPPGHAWFEGEVIYLGDGWGEAQACVVWRDEDLVECFRTEQQMEARTNEAERQHDGSDDDGGTTTMAASACGSWLYLYEDPSYDGRTLQFRDRDIWQDLDVWGFSNQLSSFKVGACSVKLAAGYGGGGGLYPGSTYPYARVSSMGGWDDEVSSIRIL